MMNNSLRNLVAYANCKFLLTQNEKIKCMLNSRDSPYKCHIIVSWSFYAHAKRRQARTL